MREMTTAKTEQVAVRCSAEQVGLIDRVAELMSARSLGLSATRAAVIRAALDRGLASMLSELAPTKAKRPRSRRTARRERKTE